jgi:hypothetical protein
MYRRYLLAAFAGASLTIAARAEQSGIQMVPGRDGRA